MGISRTESRSSATATKVVGTLAYFAPELYGAHRSQSAELRSTHTLHKEGDMYALGYVMWELFYEAEAYAGLEYVDIMQLKEQDLMGRRHPLDATETCPWKELILKCWCFDAAGRPGVRQVVTELKQLRRIFRS